jgi:pre-rRNA-processing protein TSR1
MAKKHIDNDALAGGIQPGQRVNVHLRNVPLSLQQSYNPRKPLALYSLLRHEQKRTVVNFSITLSPNYPNPLRSKDELVLHCGARRFVINPLFSQLGTTPNDVHKFQRYLHPGQTAVASFIAPLTWGSVPALFFQASPNAASTPLNLIATGTSLPPSTSRVIAKRIILTGHPYKIHKKLVTVRYMFFNKDDVVWFKALQLWTKRGRSGFIKESLGTHGYFKATFDAKINPQDAIGVSLYKRVWPRVARAWREPDILIKSHE